MTNQRDAKNVISGSHFEGSAIAFGDHGQATVTNQSIIAESTAQAKLEELRQALDSLVAQNPELAERLSRPRKDVDRLRREIAEPEPDRDVTETLLTRLINGLKDFASVAGSVAAVKTAIEQLFG
jgi:predicted nuclease with TOPRIM domain